MSWDQMMKRFEFLVFGENKWRARLSYDKSGNPRIFFDAHGMTVREAKRAVENIVRIFYLTPIHIEVVHGFHNGTAIRDMLASENFNNRLLYRNIPSRNPGITIMNMASAA